MLIHCLRSPLLCTDCYLNTCINGYPAGSENMAYEQLLYNIFLANTAHKYNMAVGLKNDVDQIDLLHPYVDFAINEGCSVYNECGKYKPFTSSNKVYIYTNTSVAVLQNYSSFFYPYYLFALFCTLFTR